jgi:hypothetical protein
MPAKLRMINLSSMGNQLFCKFIIKTTWIAKDWIGFVAQQFGVAIRPTHY